MLLWDFLVPHVLADSSSSSFASREDFEMTRALNSPGGSLAWALLHYLDSQKPLPGAGMEQTIAARLTTLSQSPTQQGRSARVIIAYFLGFVERVDPLWTAQKMLPLLAPAHPEAVDLLGSFAINAAPTARLFITLKPAILWALENCTLGLSMGILLFLEAPRAEAQP